METLREDPTGQGGKGIIPHGPKGEGIQDSRSSGCVFSEQPGMEQEAEILQKGQAAFVISIANNQWTHSEEF